MSRDVTLKRIEREIADGDLGMARDRLQGLLQAYPDDLEIRKRLGDVFWKLQYPERAGRYWYLLPSESPEMESAKRAFERRFRDSPREMLLRLRYRGGLESIRGTHAEQVLLGLAARAHVSRDVLAALVAVKQGRRTLPAERRAIHAALNAGCILVALLAVFGLLIASLTIFRWIGR